MGGAGQERRRRHRGHSARDERGPARNRAIGDDERRDLM
jgi:hypothetical protein